MVKPRSLFGRYKLLKFIIIKFEPLSFVYYHYHIAYNHLKYRISSLSLLLSHYITPSLTQQSPHYKFVSIKHKGMLNSVSEYLISILKKDIKKQN
jgi:hypothetical protein